MKLFGWINIARCVPHIHVYEVCGLAEFDNRQNPESFIGACKCGATKEFAVEKWQAIAKGLYGWPEAGWKPSSMRFMSLSLSKEPHA